MSGRLSNIRCRVKYLLKTYQDRDFMESVIFSFADWPAPPDGFPEFGPLRARRAPPARCGPSTARFSRCRPRIRLISDLIDRLSQCRARVTTDSGASRKLPKTPRGPSPGGAALTPISGQLIGAGVQCSIWNLIPVDKFSCFCIYQGYPWYIPVL